MIGLKKLVGGPPQAGGEVLAGTAPTDTLTPHVLDDTTDDPTLPKQAAAPQKCNQRGGLD
jgi:hypothetical protein